MKRIEPRRIEVAGIYVEVVRKAIGRLRISVYPPDGRVRVAVPFWIGDESLRAALIERLAWIRRHKEKFAARPRQPERRMVDGEAHWFRGGRYCLLVREGGGRETVVLREAGGPGETDAPREPGVPGRSVLHREPGVLELFVRPGSDAKHRGEVLDRWLRKRLKIDIEPLVSKWQPILGVEASAWNVRRMRTRWGSCNPARKRLWFNLELSRKPPECLEYVVVHELAHLLVSRHGAPFKALMDRHLPGWPGIRERLNEAPPTVEPRD